MGRESAPSDLAGLRHCGWPCFPDKEGYSKHNREEVKIYGFRTMFLIVEFIWDAPRNQIAIRVNKRLALTEISEKDPAKWGLRGRWRAYAPPPTRFRRFTAGRNISQSS